MLFITDTIPDVNTLISNIKNSIVLVAFLIAIHNIIDL